MADAASGLTPERLSLLSVLVFAGPMPMSRLAAVEGVSAPAITRIVTALETDGLVIRRTVSEDRRRVEVVRHDRGPLGGELEGDLAPDTSSGSGDDSNLAGQLGGRHRGVPFEGVGRWFRAR